MAYGACKGAERSPMASDTAVRSGTLVVTAHTTAHCAHAAGLGIGQQNGGKEL